MCVPFAGTETQAEGLGKTRVVTADAISFVRSTAVDGPFDVVFADPPYAGGRKDGWPKKILQALMGGPILVPNGILIVEQGADEPLPECEGWVLAREKTYGGTLLRFWGR